MENPNGPYSLGSHESAKRGQKRPYRGFALPRNTRLQTPQVVFQTVYLDEQFSEVCFPLARPHVFNLRLLRPRRSLHPLSRPSGNNIAGRPRRTRRERRAGRRRRGWRRCGPSSLSEGTGWHSPHRLTLPRGAVYCAWLSCVFCDDGDLSLGLPALC